MEAVVTQMSSVCSIVSEGHGYSQSHTLARVLEPQTSHVGSSNFLYGFRRYHITSNEPHLEFSEQRAVLVCVDVR